MTRQWGATTGFLGVPDWVPDPALHYLAHTEKGISIRALARHSECHASTILRQIRRIESRRDDVLFDEALDRLGRRVAVAFKVDPCMETLDMKAQKQDDLLADPMGDEAFSEVAWDILHKLSAPDAVLAVAQDMERAVVVQDLPDGSTARTAVVDRPVAQAMALKDWISCKTTGRISRYRITPAGRTALADSGVSPVGQGNKAAGSLNEQGLEQGNGQGGGLAQTQRRLKMAGQETPLAVLARRRDRLGNPFLTRDLVAIGERLREDFELSQIEPGMTQNWDHFMTPGLSGGARELSGPEAAQQARVRLNKALDLLGEGLSDIAMRCCCQLEGLEATERRLGWPARSGKVVLRIALIRLREFYAASDADGSNLIG